METVATDAVTRGLLGGMTVLELVSTVILLVTGLAIRVGMQYFKAKLTEEDAARLERLSRMAIGAAEEIGTREQWTGAQKLAYAQDLIKAGFPKADKDLIDAAIHAALAFAQIGNVGASDIRKFRTP